MIMRKTKIAIVDSGISDLNTNIPEPIFKMTIDTDENGEIIVHKNTAIDEIGHGSAIASLISTNASNIELYIIKVFKSSMQVNEIEFIYSIEYCIDNICPDIIHLSNGIKYCENLEYFKEICKKAEEKGIIIISAFDNFGSISYPAAFKNVLGVDVSDKLKDVNSYIFIERSDVNILVPNITHRLPWKNGEYFLSNGTSFNTCFVTAMVANILSKKSLSFYDVLYELKSNAKFIISNKKRYYHNDYASPQTAVVFPFNKEIHSLVRFKSLLTFNLQNIYDTKYMRQIGKYPEDIIGMKRGEESQKIFSYESINWEKPFDTFILGHTSEIESKTNRHYSMEIVDNCLKYSKSLYSFSKFNNYEDYRKMFKEKNLKLYIPCIEKKDKPELYGGKLRSIGIPILGIFGTSSRQGKFSLQLKLREYFIKSGYKVGQLGTEPTSKLFGFDEVYPIGYESTVELQGLDSIATLNSMMGRIEDKYPDIILVGSQSQTIPQQWGNLSLYVLYQNDFIYGTEPDVIVLCVNIFDQLDYIERTINYLESIISTTVIALVLFPMERAEKGGGTH